MRALILLAGLLLWGCSASETKQASKQVPVQLPTAIFHPDSNPKTLAEWGVASAQNDELILANASLVYDLNTPLFSDYALKLRAVQLPDGLTVKLNADQDSLDFPIGTIISKTFYYPKGDQARRVLKPTAPPTIENNRLDLSVFQLIETRLLVRREAGWEALPYVWDDAQETAKLKRTGDLKRLTLMDGNKTSEFAYLVPNVNQCSGCHATNNTTRAIIPIGPKLRHLTSTEGFGLSAQPSGYFQNVDWSDTGKSLDERARAYLDINCSHCHNKNGPADTSGLNLEPGTPMGPSFGRCKTPIAAGTGTGNRKYGIVPGKPDKSIFAYRMESVNPAVMMPELGRALAHDEGVELITDWIESLSGECEAG